LRRPNTDTSYQLIDTWFILFAPRANRIWERVLAADTMIGELHAVSQDDDGGS
jgi:hypothetical protein